MHVGVGSGNPVKLRATEAALGVDAATPVASGEVRVSAVSVPSGVPEQPRGHAETIRGAETRARAVLAVDEGGRAGGDGGRPGDATAAYDLGVGIEGGVATVPGVESLFLVMWAAVTDGETVGRGAGPSLALPSSIADRVRAGAELGPVMDDVLGETDVARGRGAAGALTGGATDRESALASAVTAALGPFRSGLYARERD